MSIFFYYITIFLPKKIKPTNILLVGYFKFICYNQCNKLINLVIALIKPVKVITNLITTSIYFNVSPPFTNKSVEQKSTRVTALVLFLCVQNMTILNIMLYVVVFMCKKSIFCTLFRRKIDNACT